MSITTPIPTLVSRSSPSDCFCNFFNNDPTHPTPHAHHPPSTNLSTGTTSSTVSRKKGGRSSRSQKTKTKIKPTKNLDLTEESLKEFNRRTAANDKKNSSPYYKGLTDSSLVINRERPDRSPGRDSTSTAVTSSSISTVLTKIHEWSTSCFKTKGDKEENQANTEKNTTTFEVKEVDTTSYSVETKKSVVFEEKPLRERVSKTGAQPVFVSKRVIVVEKKNKEVSINSDKERKFVWADKYRPKALKDFICNRETAEELQASVHSGACSSHYIFEGRYGVGKRTMVWALLREAFGAEQLVTSEECMQFELKGEAVASINVNVQVSPHHIEINLSELRGYEKNVIVELIRERHTIGLNDDIQCDHSNCHVIILNEADMLSNDAQLYIRWLMEKTKANNKVFFCCNDASKLQAVKSICKVVQLNPPSNKEIVEVLEFIAEQEGIQLPHKLVVRIAENSKQNLRQAIRSFEATYKLKYPFIENQVIITGWEEDIANIAKYIIEEQSPKQLYVIRGKLQSLIEHNVSPAFIFRTLVDELKNLLGDVYHPKIDALYQEYNSDGGCFNNIENAIVLSQSCNDGSRVNKKHEMKKNIQQFMMIEEFTAKFMSFYKSSRMSNGE